MLQKVQSALLRHSCGISRSTCALIINEVISSVEPVQCDSCWVIVRANKPKVGELTGYFGTEAMEASISTTIASELHSAKSSSGP